MGALMNFNITEVNEGRAVFTVEPAEYHYNPIGVVHGGLAATLLDSAMGVRRSLDVTQGCGVYDTGNKGQLYPPDDGRDGTRALRSEDDSCGADALRP